MRKFLWTSGALAAVFALGLTACDSGSGGSTTDNDTSIAEDTTGGGGDFADTSVADTSEGTDTTPSDPCDPNPCTTPPAAACNAAGDAVVTYASPGTCTANGGAAECAYTSTETACGADEVCAAATGACLAAGDPCDYSYDEKVSVVTKIAVGAAAGQPGECCFDFNDDGTVDNKLGSLLTILGSVLGDADVNSMIQDQLTTGKLIVLLEEVGVDSLTDDDALTINGFVGEDADGDAANNFSGSAEFLAGAASFVPGTAAPLISFPDAAIAGGTLTAGPSLFALSLPLFEGAPLSLTISQASVEATVAAGPNGKGLNLDGTEVDGDGVTYGAKLGGVVKMSELFAALDAFMANSCVVLNTDNGKFITDDGQCPSAASVDTSACDDNDPAKQVAGFCAAALSFLKPDIDTDEDGEADAISVGLWLKATSASIVGTEGCDVR